MAVTHGGADTCHQLAGAERLGNIIIRSSVQTKETVEIDGVTYPMFKLDTSSASHPFYTGAQTRIVEAGRVEKFRAKFAAKQQALNAAAAAAKAAK